MALGDLVKDLILRFKVDGWQLAKDKIDSIPDEKTIKLDMDSSAFGGALESLKMKLMQSGYDSGRGFWSSFFSNAAFRGFGKINLPGFLPNLSGFFTSGTGLAVIAAAAGTLLTFVDQLASGFVAAGMGLASFAALAYPTFSTISGAVTQINTDMTAYQNATTKAARSDALKKIHADWAALDPVQKTAVQNVIALQSQWDQLAADFEKQIAPILNTLLEGPQRTVIGLRGSGKGPVPVYGPTKPGGVIYQILQDLPKFANIAAQALVPLINAFNQFLGSPGAQQFMATMQSIEKLALPAIGQGIGQVALAIGKLFTVFSAKDDARAIKFAFDIIVGAIDAVVFVLKTLQGMWDATSRLLGPVLKYLEARAKEWWKATAGAIGDVIHAWDNVRHFVFVAAMDIYRFERRMVSDIEQWYRDVVKWLAQAVSWWKSLPGKIIAALAALPGELFSMGVHIIQALISGMNSQVGAVGAMAVKVANIVAGHFPNSPAKYGPFSGIGAPEKRGEHISWALSQGMLSGLGYVSMASSVVAGAAAGGLARGAGRGYARGGGDTYIFNVAPLTDPHKTAVEIQRMLLSLKRRRFGQGATGSGLGLA